MATARQPLPDKCHACGAPLPLDERFPIVADMHLLDGAMVCTCSPVCRQRLGLRERKVAVTGMEAIK